jgi:sulfite dehydrogenase (cytochrome) subunit B
VQLRTPLFLFALVVALGAASVPLGAQQDNGLPPGDGRDIVAATCSQCHSLTAITHLREGRQAWKHQVYDMIQRGAQVAPAELDTVVNYLTANFGPGIPFPGQTPSHVVLAAGAGSEIVAGKCSLCHSVDRVVSVKRSRSQWTSLVAHMMYLGAPLTPDQSKSVVDYLSTNYSVAGKT